MPYLLRQKLQLASLTTDGVYHYKMICTAMFV